MDYLFFITSFVSLFTIINPFSTVSVFLTITPGKSVQERIAMARRSAIVSFTVLIAFALAGEYILHFFSITIDALKIAAGIIVAILGYKMIGKTREHLVTYEEKEHAIDREDVSIVPLAIPMISGAGSMTTTLVLMSQARDMFDVGMLLSAIFVAIMLTYFILSRAHIIDEHIGALEKKIISKIMGLIVMVVGVQFFLNGVISVFGL